MSLDANTCPSRTGTAPVSVQYLGFVLAFELTSGVRQMVLEGAANWEGSLFPEADLILAYGVR